MDYQVKNLDAYLRLLRSVDGCISWNLPHPINRDRKASPIPELHDILWIGIINYSV